MKITAGIEGGGTKFNVGIGNEKGEILDKVRINTGSSEDTMREVIAYLKTKKFEGIGVGVFGPVELDATSPDYGKILNTPKAAWKNFNLYQALKKYFFCPIIIEHDVNAALLGELKWGAAQGLRDAVYYTVGTGIGAGLCLEGLVSGLSIEKRYGQRAENIPKSSPLWPVIAYYLAAACANTLFCFAPQRIILGGGVMNVEGLLPLIRREYIKILSGYDQKPLFVDTNHFIVRAALENDPGLMGSFALAF